MMDKETKQRLVGALFLLSTFAFSVGAAFGGFFGWLITWLVLGGEG